MTKHEVIQKITDSGLVAVVRANDAEQAKRITEACVAGGVGAIEITFTVPGAQEIIRELCLDYAGAPIVIGAGTVLDAETARTAILQGAQYIVSPCLNAETIRLGQRYQIPVMPGAMTVKEVVEGMEAGADVIKLFPGEMFGPSFVKAIRGPLPQARIMPTGGVDLGNVGEWIKAGCVAVGVGGNLTSGAQHGDYQSIADRAKKFIAAIVEARESLQ